MARAAGINFLRVWGGGIREKRAFWDTCDRLGIMAWQEFPLACAFLDHYPRDRAYLEVLAQEAQGIVQLLRNHPSLIAWCGGNEFNIGREHAALAVLAQATAGDAQARPFIPASPAPGEVHQWSVWHGYAPWATLAHETAPLMNEFGMQALPAAETIAEMFPEGAPTSLDDPLWAERKAQAAKLRWYAGIEASAALPAAIEATQRSQAAALQVGIEGCRLRREAADQPAEDGQIGCRGVAFWQFNEPWPAVSWSVVDRAGRPKLAYAMLRRSFQPLLVAARFPWQRYEPGTLFAAEIWLVNDGPEGAEGCRVEARLDDRLIWAQQGVALPAAAARRIGNCAIRLDAAPAEFTLILARDNTVLAENRYDLAVHLPPRQPQSARLRRWFADRLLGT
jgi:beta-mannosidase